jgi:NADPH:quinone reductase-like Zn-dependent oxidoreductase
VDVVADVVGGERWADLIGLLRKGGRYTVAGAIGGPLVELDLRTVYLADLTLSGVTVTPPGLFRDLVDYIERGEIRPFVAATYPLEAAREAQAAFMEKRHVGKVVLDLG